MDQQTAARADFRRGSVGTLFQEDLDALGGDLAHLTTALLPVLSRQAEPQFNVFDVMHHGTHEKQLSNVFGWLLDTQGTHQLGDTFLKIFIEEVNRGLPKSVSVRFAVTDYMVQQEVNTAAADQAQDIADLVLNNDDAVLVVENYYTSDGHDHSYDGYLEHSRRQGKDGAVVLLCQDRDSSRQTQGWEDASVVTYGALLQPLWQAVEGDRKYQLEHPEPYSFIDQMHRKFVKGRGRVEDKQVLDFVVAMCSTGEAARYGEQKQGSAAERFANEVAEQARERFGEGRELLRRVKDRLTNYGREHLRTQLNRTYGEGFVGHVNPSYRGNFEWTVSFGLPGFARSQEAESGEKTLYLKFGPSAWFANERDSHWSDTINPGEVGYSHVFIAWEVTREIRQSAVTIQELLDGLSRDDLRLHDEIVQMLSGAD